MRIQYFFCALRVSIYLSVDAMCSVQINNDELILVGFQMVLNCVRSKEANQSTFVFLDEESEVA